MKPPFPYYGGKITIGPAIGYARCTETGCSALVSDVPGNRCDGPTGAGCGELFCGDHLFATERDGLLCAADYNRIEDRVADLDALP